jgi:hypothetical protein
MWQMPWSRRRMNGRMRFCHAWVLVRRLLGLLLSGSGCVLQGRRLGQPGSRQTRVVTSG